LSSLVIWIMVALVVMQALNILLLCFFPLDANVMHSCIQTIQCLYYWKLDLLSVCTHILSSISLFANWTNGARSTRGTRSSRSTNRASVTTLTLEKNKEKNTFRVLTGWNSICEWTSHHFQHFRQRNYLKSHFYK